MFLPGSPFTLAKHTGQSYMSVGLLIGGIVAARFGLWLTDLAITQISQEKVEARNRGKIGGVQSALNSGMDMIKYALVLSFPKAHQFGYLVFASYASIVSGAVLYITYALGSLRRAREEQQEKVVYWEKPPNETTPLIINRPLSPPTDGFVFNTNQSLNPLYPPKH